VDAFDATAFAKTEDPAEQAAALGFAFARSLIAQQGWPSFKALLAGVILGRFLRSQMDCKDPFKHELSTKLASQSKPHRGELRDLRALWLQDFRFAPHPDLVIGYAERVLKEGFFGRPHASAAFFEAVVYLGTWLLERGFIENPVLVEATQRHFKRRIAESGDALFFMANIRDD